MRASVLCLLLGATLVAADWPDYGGNQARTRYSPLTQITPANVSSLAVAWTYDTGDAFKGSEMQCQPVVARGVLYATSPTLRVFALDAATGAVKWSFNPLEGETTPSRTRIRVTDGSSTPRPGTARRGRLVASASWIIRVILRGYSRVGSTGTGTKCSTAGNGS